MVAGKQNMTDDQVNLIVQHLCRHLNLAMRLKGTEAHPAEAKDIGFDPRFCKDRIANRIAFGRRCNPS
jgi:hypothetical protein